MPDKNIIPTDAREALKQISQSLERLQADPAIQKIARTLSDLRHDPRFAHFRNWHEQRQRPKTRNTKPTIEIPHLDEAIDQVFRERWKSRKAGAGRVMRILKTKFNVIVPSSQERTIQRRIEAARKARGQISQPR
jgi:hypothetical protein